MTLTFDADVVSWPDMPGRLIDARTYSVSNTGSGKFAFAPADAGVTELTVRADGRGCSATARVVLASK